MNEVKMSCLMSEHTNDMEHGNIKHIMLNVGTKKRTKT